MFRSGAGPSTALKVEFIDRHKDEHGAWPICDALAETSAAIAPSSYYAAKTRPPSARSLRDAELTAAITTMYEENYHVYGARKMFQGDGPRRPPGRPLHR